MGFFDWIRGKEKKEDNQEIKLSEEEYNLINSSMLKLKELISNDIISDKDLEKINSRLKGKTGLEQMLIDLVFVKVYDQEKKQVDLKKLDLLIMEKNVYGKLLNEVNALVGLVYLKVLESFFKRKDVQDKLDEFSIEFSKQQGADFLDGNKLRIMVNFIVSDVTNVMRILGNRRSKDELKLSEYQKLKDTILMIGTELRDLLIQVEKKKGPTDSTNYSGDFPLFDWTDTDKPTHISDIQLLRIIITRPTFFIDTGSINNFKQYIIPKLRLKAENEDVTKKRAPLKKVPIIEEGEITKKRIKRK